MNFIHNNYKNRKWFILIRYKNICRSRNMEQLDHLTSEQLVVKFSTVTNYAVLVGERRINYLYRRKFFFYRSTFWFVWFNWSLLLEKRRPDNAGGDIIRWTLSTEIWNIKYEEHDRSTQETFYEVDIYNIYKI